MGAETFNRKVGKTAENGKFYRYLTVALIINFHGCFLLEWVNLISGGSGSVLVLHLKFQSCNFLTTHVVQKSYMFYPVILVYWYWGKKIFQSIAQNSDCFE